MKHWHHIVPKHAGGTDDPGNLVQLSIEDHALAHKSLYEEYGRWQDYAAWQGLAKLVGKEEHLAYIAHHAGKAGNAKRGLNTGMKYDTSKIVASGQRKGAGNPCARVFTVTHPDGREEQVKSLKTWCAEHGLNYNTFHVTCIARKGKHKGFTAHRAF
jgi:hypothetical protein